MGFFDNMNSKLQTFMVGRNGSDRMGRWCLFAAIAFLVINMVWPNVFCSMLSFALLFYCIYRMFSTNVIARREENERFEELITKLPFVKPEETAQEDTRTSPSRNGSKKTSGNKAKAKKTASKKTFTCEECGQSLSVPKGRGKLKVTCPKCHHQMKVES